MFIIPGFTDPVTLINTIFSSIICNFSFGQCGNERYITESRILASCSFVRGAAENDAVHLVVFRFLCQIFDAVFYINGPNPKMDKSVLFVAM